MANRRETDGAVAECFSRESADGLCARLADAEIAYGRVNDVVSLLKHPHLRRVVVASPTGPVNLPAPPAIDAAAPAPAFGAIPALGEHTAAVRREFLPA
jgi:crotonobetainyl-CoA:carnitine CoA-transferase CaiB-like acyl-CoA transferase